MRQHDEAYQQDLAAHLARARKTAAAQFRVHWESQKPATTEADNDEGSISALCKPGTMGDSLQRRTTPAGCNSRPFLRRKWLERVTKASGRSCTGSDFTRGEGPPAQTNGKPPGVTRDHLRSVIQLALSDACVNAFVVMSCLDGMLSVASEGTEKDQDGRRANAPAKIVETVSGSSTVTGTGVLSENTSTLAESSVPTSLDGKARGTLDGATIGTAIKKKASGTENRLPPSRGALSPACARASASASASHHSMAARGWSTTASQSGGMDNIEPCTSSTSSSESGGASLCVQLGALPAVLGCLRQHAGHSRIEPQGVALLYQFARDSATCNAVRGNVDVLAACASRMHPVPPPRSTDTDGASLASSPAETDSVRKHSLGGGDHDSIAADKDITDGRRPEHLIASLQEPSGAASQHGQIDNPCLPTSAISPAGAPAPNERVPMATNPPSMVTEPSSALIKAPKPRSATAAPNAAVPPAEEDTACPQLPAPDLVFVLSVALQGSPECQDLAIQQGGIAAMLATLGCLTCSSAGSGGSDARLVETSLRVLEHLGERGEGRRRLVKEGCVDATIATIGRFR